jgi:nitrilase
VGDEYPVVKLAAVQASSVYLEREPTVAKACRLIGEAAAAGAKVIGFPEGYIPGHPLWHRYYTATSAETRGFATALFRNAVEVPSDATAAVGEAARRTGTYVLIGVCEREPGSIGTLYNTMLLFGPSGRVLGRHRKIMPTGSERLVHAPGDGSGLRTYKTPFGPIGGLLCGENTNSLARVALLLQGERIHVASWPAFSDPRGASYRAMDIRVQIHAFEGRIFVISSAAVIDEQTWARLGLPAEKMPAAGSRGGHSGILGPRGDYIAGPADDREQILYAEADENEIVAERIFQDVTGHYNRFDIFSLEVDRRVPEKLTFSGDNAAARVDVLVADVDGYSGRDAGLPTVAPENATRIQGLGLT